MIAVVAFAASVLISGLPGGRVPGSVGTAPPAVSGSPFSYWDAAPSSPLCGGNLSATIHAAPPTGAAPLTVNFTLSLVGGCGPFQAEWQFGDEADAHGLALSHVFYGAGTYSVIVEVMDSSGASAFANTTVLVTGGGGPLSVHVDASPATGTAPLSTTLWANVSGANVTDGWRTSWSFGDGGWGSGSPVQHLYRDAGRFNAVATIQGDHGVLGVGNFSIRVGSGGGTPGLELSIRATPESGDAPLNVTLVARSDGAPPSTALQVCFGDGSACRIAAPPGSDEEEATVSNHTYTVPGNFTILGSLLAPNGTVLVGASTSVTVTPAAPLQVGPEESSSAGGAPATVTFTATVTGGTAPYSLQWDFGDGGVGSAVVGRGVQHTYVRAGVFQPTLTVTDGVGHRWSGHLPAVNIGVPLPTGWSSTVGGIGLLDVLALGLAAAVAAGIVLGRFSLARRRERRLRREGEDLVREMEQEK